MSTRQRHKKPRTVELDIVDLAFTGQAVGYIDGKVTFVKGGLPGEKILVNVTKIKKKHNEAKLLKILEKSPERIEPVCEHYDICGGCIWQDLGYERQLHYKRNQVIACLKHLGGFDDIAVDAIVPSPDQFYYRNKMEFSCDIGRGENESEALVLGLHHRGRFDRTFNVQRCHLQTEVSNRIVRFVRDWTLGHNLPAYDLIAHEGVLRYVVVRDAKNTGQAMVTIQTAEHEFPQRYDLVSDLLEAVPEITTVVWVVNPTITNIARGEIREILHGPGYIVELVLGRRFRINPGAFFQTNTRQTEALYRAAIEAADLDGSETLLDLYCGAGTIGICAADRVREVIGIDIEKESIDAAAVNAELNDVTNCTFYHGDAHKVMDGDEFQKHNFGVLIIDPPRAGMHPKALKAIMAIRAPKLVYISCNPATFARDAAELREVGYRLEGVRPFDMFPHTMHIELVSRFTLIED